MTVLDNKLKSTESIKSYQELNRPQRERRRLLVAMNREVQNLIAVLLIAVVWVFFSVGVTLKLADAEDPPNPATAPEPRLLKAIYSVVTFPVQTFEPWDWMRSHLGERPAMRLEYLGMFIDGLLWGCAFVFVYRFVSSFVGKVRRKTDAALG